MNAKKIISATYYVTKILTNNLKYSTINKRKHQYGI